MKKETIKKFKNPPREYGIYPIIHGDMENWRELLPYHKECGFAGVAANPKWDNAYPHNQAAWDRFAEGCRAYAAEGMKLWLYDEKGYPSGTAGGAVLDKYPELEALELMCFNYPQVLTGAGEYRADTPSGNLFRAYLIPQSENAEALDITDKADAKGVLRLNIPKGKYRLTAYI